MKDKRMIFYRKLRLGLYALLGYVYKILVDLHLIAIPKLNKRKATNVIVSLTSYGRRVKTIVVYYTIVSLLRQKLQPDRIVLWLAEDEWTDDSIPPRLYKLKEKGVEICYCKDIKSYKKLVPTLKKYPTSTIVTVDDDMIYSRDTLDVLLKEHEIHPHEILCLDGRMPLIENGLPKAYRDWEELDKETEGMLVFPVGVGGTLYPVGALANKVLSEDVFMSICPMADDVWFWYCGIEKGTNKRFITKKGVNWTFDSLYQYFHKGSALTHSNSEMNQNDYQIKGLLRYYGYNTINDIMK